MRRNLPRPLPDGSLRRVLCHDGHMMAVEVHFPRVCRRRSITIPIVRSAMCFPAASVTSLVRKKPCWRREHASWCPRTPPFLPAPWRRACCWTYSPRAEDFLQPNGSEKDLLRKGTFAQMILHAQKVPFLHITLTNSNLYKSRKKVQVERMKVSKGQGKKYFC